jgi:PhnB protein
MEEVPMAKAASPVPKGLNTITPQLTLSNGAATLEFYKRAFGAKELSRSLGPDGKIMHAEIEIGNSRFYANDVMMGKGPKEYGGSPASFWLYVPDADALFNQAMAAGAEVRMPLEDQFWGDRAGAVADPEGYSWWIATRKEDFTPEEMKKRAEDFFASQAQTANR